ncbi:MAG: phosphatase PAP2 family protein [Spirochaetaceae bacterium]|nr:phosphatase PAP2 family protein [Spirochaetaceae bacterium]
MQKEMLMFFTSISNPILDSIANLASFFGEEAIIIIILGWILYGIDKKKGFAICGSILSATIAMGIIKAIVRAPRPFQVLTEIKGKRLSTATGYSFPSGHASVSSSMYSSIAIAFKKKTLSIICATTIVLVAISRMYLGVHWPIDVFGGIIIGITSSFILYSVFYKISGDKTLKQKVSLRIGSIFFVVSFILCILLSNNLIDTVAFSDLLKTIALAGGAYFGFFFESKYINYSVDGKTITKIARLIILVICSLLIIVGIKALFGVSYYYIGAFVRYNTVGIFLTYLFPLIFKKLFN